MRTLCVICRRLVRNIDFFNLQIPCCFRYKIRLCRSETGVHLTFIQDLLSVRSTCYKVAAVFSERRSKTEKRVLWSKYSTAPSADLYSVELSSPSAIRKVAARIKKEHENPTVLINNAQVRGRRILDFEQPRARQREVQSCLCPRS